MLKYIIILIIVLILSLLIYNSINHREEFTLVSSNNTGKDEASMNLNSVFNDDTVYINNISTPNFNFLSPKTIIMWYGDTNNIPKGWILCDGKNNTPDLTNKFIFGGKSYTTGSDSIVATGPATSSDGTHVHSTSNKATNFLYDINLLGQDKDTGIRSYSPKSEGAHNHSSITLTSAKSIKPKWASLVFIMKT